MALNKIKYLFTILIFTAIPGYGQENQNIIYSGKNAGSKKVVFIAGTDSHGKGEHEHNGGSILLAKKLKESVADIETVVCQNGWPKDASILKNAASIVIYCDGGGDHMLIPHLEDLDSLARKGVGLVMIHFTLEIPAGKTGDYFLNWIGGYFKTDWSVNPVWTAQFETFPNHPVTNGVKPFTISDEWYYHMRFVKDMKNVTPILKTLPPASTLNRPIGTHSNNQFVSEAVLEKKEPQTLAWAYQRSYGGRGFGFTGGHVHANWGNDNFRKLVLNAIAWTANVKIPKEGIQTETPSQVELDSLTKQVK